MHPLKEIIRESRGIASFCTANSIVLEAVIEEAASRGGYVLIEATANQVNQFDGYTGMKPADFAAFIHELARKARLDEKFVILGGDHLGPLVWKNEPESSAMEKSVELVVSYVEAGFTKIHLDTSMRLADDDPSLRLTNATIARRGAVLAKAAVAALEKRRGYGGGVDGAGGGDERGHGRGDELVFVIGSEVPIPGGAQGHEESVSVTAPNDFVDTISAYRGVFEAEGLSAIWDDVVGVVVQPGVEFSDDSVFQYDRKAAADLIKCLGDYPGLVFEGHSTDYQSPESLKKMVEDGVRILKVGPELTFALREGLLSMSLLEEEMIPDRRRHSQFRSVLEEEMLSDPVYWEKYYTGTEEEKRLSRLFSYSDRCRYYLGKTAVADSIEKLFENVDSVEKPFNVIRQYFPSVCELFRTNGGIAAGSAHGTTGGTVRFNAGGAVNRVASARDMIKIYIRESVLNKYRYAVSCKQL